MSLYGVSHGRARYGGYVHRVPHAATMRLFSGRAAVTACLEKPGRLLRRTQFFALTSRISKFGSEHLSFVPYARSWAVTHSK